MLPFRPVEMPAAITYSIVLLLVSAAAHYAVLSWAFAAFPRLLRWRTQAWGVLALLVALTPASRWLSLAFRASIAPRVLAFGMVELMAVVLGVFPILLLRGAIRYYYGATAPLPLPPPQIDTQDPELSREPVDTLTPAVLEAEMERHAATQRGAEELAAASQREAHGALTRRQVLERISGVAVLGTSAAVLGWGMVRGRHAFTIEEVAVKIPGLPRALDGYTLAQISDIHTGLFVGERELAEGLSRLAEVRADMILATGDLVDIDPHFVPLMAASLGRLSARDGVVAILGNHDYYTNARTVVAGLRSVGIRTLVDEAMHVRPNDGGGFALLGVDDFSGRRVKDNGISSLERAIARAPADRARILLAHQPRYFHVAAGRVALQLSGHTHGGQINPGFRPADLFMSYVSGRYEEQGSTLYVNRGFGVAGPPSRVGAPPEVTKIVLVAA